MSSILEVDTFALIQNVRAMREVVGELPILAVVKGNAYGHDLAIASEALWRGGVDGFVVTDPLDAKWLSEQRYKLPILVLFPVPDELLNYALGAGWHLAITSQDYYLRLEHFARTRRKPVKIQIEVDTGMHRTGIALADVEALITKSELTNTFMQITGMFTHMYFVDNEQVSSEQMNTMRELQFNLQRKKIPVPITHVLRSDGLALYGEDYMFDAVRLGAALYGFCPHFSQISPVLTWKTEIITLGELKAGETVGYEKTFKAERRLKIATLPVGYADGIDQRMSNKGSVLVGGKLCPIIGRVSMNHTVIDVTSVFRVEPGAEAVLLGKQKGNEITLAHIKNWTGMSEYEYVTRISRSITRIKSK